MNFILFACSFFFCVSTISAQEYCVQFSKEGKKTVVIKEGRNISFVFKGTEGWNKAKIIKISTDSIFLEQPISKKDILTERESNYVVKGYGLEAFRMMAHNSAIKSVGKGSAVVIIFSLAILSGGADFVSIFSGEENSSTQKKFFKKNIDFDKGWNADIILNRKNL